MAERGILEYRLFWYHRFFRTLMGIGALMMTLTGCIWAFQYDRTPQAVLLVLLAGVAPLRAGRLLSRRVRRGAMPCAASVALLAGSALLIRLRDSRLEWRDLLLMVLTASVAELLMRLADEQVERRVLPVHLRAAGRRVSGYTVNAAGIVAPATVAALMASCPYYTAVAVALLVMVAGAALSLVTALTALRRAPGAEGAPEAAGTLYPDTALAYFVLNFCLAMTHGALLMPMLLSRATVSDMAAAVVWFFAGLSLGQLFDPLQHFYASERRGYVRNCALALILLALLFGMSRTGWQWNACAGWGGVLLAAGWGNLEQMRVRHHRRLSALRACAWISGLALGIGCGNALEWIMARFGALSRICARLTGLGEGSGMAMTFVVARALGLAALYVGGRMIRGRE